MAKGRFSSIMTLVIVLNCLLVGPALAGFGFGGNDEGKSGLDFNKGYDVNTVTTVSGHVASPPRSGEKGYIFVEIKAGAEAVNLSLGPGSFWNEKEFPLHQNDEIIAKGSKAQGKDGKTYLMVQKLTNRTTGAQTVVRNELGVSAWSGRNESGMRSNGPAGAMMRDGGMMRGGGGMMRR